MEAAGCATIARAGGILVTFAALTPTGPTRTPPDPTRKSLYKISCT